MPLDSNSVRFSAMDAARCCCPSSVLADCSIVRVSAMSSYVAARVSGAITTAADRDATADCVFNCGSGARTGIASCGAIDGVLYMQHSNLHES
jgi:hypothetical protein